MKSRSQKDGGADHRERSTRKRSTTMGRHFVSLDWAMKKILRDKANFCVLEGFLSELLREEVKIEEILESESNREHARDKQNRVDIKVRRGSNEIVLVEIQFQRDLNFFHRLLFGVSKAVTEHIEQGSNYREVNKVISVNILYFDPGIGDDYIYHGTTSFLGMHSGNLLDLTQAFHEYLGVNRLFQIFPEYYLLCVPKFTGTPKDTLDQWLYFLKTEQIERNFSARGLREAKEVLLVANLTPPQRRAYEDFEDEVRCAVGDAHQHQWEVGKAREEGREEGREQGREEGREEARELLRRLAKRLLSEGVDKQAIALSAGCTFEEVEELLDKEGEIET
jgi:predicted transposase/invertase (TIGR01784 family)